MTPGELDYLAAAYEPDAPGFAAVLANWALVVGHDPVAVARESLAALALAQQLQSLAPEDALHGEVVELLEVVMVSTSHVVFTRDARRFPMVSLYTRLADVARGAASKRFPQPTVIALEVVLAELTRDFSEEADHIRGLISAVQTFSLSLSANQLAGMCMGVVALLEGRERTRLAELASKAATDVENEDPDVDELRTLVRNEPTEDAS